MQKLMLVFIALFFIGCSSDYDSLRDPLTVTNIKKDSRGRTKYRAAYKGEEGYPLYFRTQAKLNVGDTVEVVKFVKDTSVKPDTFPADSARPIYWHLGNFFGNGS